jgi:hypothetical protein
LTVKLRDERSGDSFDLAHARNVMDVFNHPYAYRVAPGPEIHPPRGIPKRGRLADNRPDGKHPVPAVSAGGGGFPLLRHASRSIAR